MRRAEGVGHFFAAHHRHDDIDEYQARPFRFVQTQGLVPVFRFYDGVTHAIEQALERGADRWRIIDDQNSHRCPAR